MKPIFLYAGNTFFQNPSDKILMSKIRIFSYLPNPRVWKAVIAGKLCNVEVEVIGDKPKNLPNWIQNSSKMEPK